MIDNNLEECIHQQNLVRLNGRTVKQHWLWRSMEAITVQNWLHHDQGLGQILSI